MITKDMIIGDVVNKFPHSVEIMLSYGLHCIGCAANPHETIEQGAKAHGLDDDTIDNLVKELNDSMPEQKEYKDGDVIVTLTENAAKKAKELIKEDNKEGYGLRILVQPGGCSGLNYELDFENTKQYDDITYEQHGLKIYIKKGIIQFINGMALDYINTLNQQGFIFENPNAKKSCGCGSSFSV